MIDRIDLSKVKRVSLITRPSKVQKSYFAKTLKTPVSFNQFWESIPHILAGQNLKNLIAAILCARKKNKPVILTFGAHVIKCGLAPLIIDLMNRNVITALATNGASTIHDFELSFAGQTSEDVAERLCDGSFGMTEQTGKFINEAAKKASITGQGLGKTIGEEIENNKLKYRNMSIFANAYKLNVPITVHVAIGTDIIYQHPECDGAAWGKASYNDFLSFADTVSNLGDGGVLLNFGSAVIIPEVFLKALTICRNLGYKVFNFTTANFDMIRQYRPTQNIVSRPTKNNGHGYDFAGHHEIMFPLLYAAILSNIK